MMKSLRIPTLLFLLATSCISALAQIDYGISVGGVKVTSENESSVKGAGIKSGSVTYADGTLSLDNVVIESTDSSEPAIVNEGAASLTIKFKGSNTLKCSNGPCVKLGKYTTMEGGSLTLTGKDGIELGAGIQLKMGTIDCTIDCERTGIRATDDNGGGATLLLVGTRLDIKNTTTAIGPLTNCQLENCDVKSPAYTCFRRATKGFTSEGSSELVETLTVEPFPSSGFYQYSVAICGKWLNSFNASNFAVDGMQSGRISYDNKKSVLRLENVHINASAQYGIFSLHGNLTVIFAGEENNLNLIGGHPILTMGNCTILHEPGEGTVNMSSTGSNSSSIKLMSGVLTFDGTDSDASFNLNAYYGIYCNQVQVEGAIFPTLKFVNSPKVTINGTNAAIGGDGSQIVFDGVSGFSGQHSPYVYDLDKKVYVDQKTGSPLLQMSIVPAIDYGMRIYGFAVNSTNSTDILGDGKLSYKSDSQTLTMNGVKADFEQLGKTNFLEFSGKKPLNIVLKGQNSISWGNIALGCDAILSSGGHNSGALTLQKCKMSTRALEVKDCSLLIADGQDEDGSTLHGTASSDLTFSGSVDAKFHSQAVGSYRNVKLSKGVYFQSPKEAAYNSSLNGFAVGGKAYDGQIRITGAWKKADVNGDDRLSIADIIAIANYLAGDKKYKLETVDVNGDGRASVADIVNIANNIAKGE